MTRRDITQAVVLFLVIVIVLVSWGYERQRDEQENRNVTCVSAQASIDQLTALREIADQLGVPVTFEIPEVPAECVDT